jgi:hypothetical protein
MKEKAFEHPYPTIKDKIDNFGYDPKQLLHIIRLYIMIYEYFNDKKSFGDCIKLTNIKTIEYLKDIKKGILPYNSAKETCEYNMTNAKLYKEKIEKQLLSNPNTDYKTKYLFKEISEKIIYNNIIKEIKNGRI